jgi:hypothetical protein
MGSDALFGRCTPQGIRARTRAGLAGPGGAAAACVPTCAGATAAVAADGTGLAHPAAGTQPAASTQPAAGTHPYAGAYSNAGTRPNGGPDAAAPAAAPGTGAHAPDANPCPAATAVAGTRPGGRGRAGRLRLAAGAGRRPVHPRRRARQQLGVAGGRKRRCEPTGRRAPAPACDDAAPGRTAPRQARYVRARCRGHPAAGQTLGARRRGPGTALANVGHSATPAARAARRTPCAFRAAELSPPRK